MKLKSIWNTKTTLVLLGFIVILLSTFIIVNMKNRDVEKSINGSQLFLVDEKTGDSKIIFGFRTLDGKKAFEVNDSQWKDSTKYLETKEMELKNGIWTQGSMSQSPYASKDYVRTAGTDSYIILEIVDPNIESVKYESKQDKTVLPIYNINSRRFVAFYQYIDYKTYYQVYALNKEGKEQWKLFNEDFWKNENK